MHLSVDSVNFELKKSGTKTPAILQYYVDPFGGASIRKGAYNRDITVFQLFILPKLSVTYHQMYRPALRR